MLNVLKILKLSVLDKGAKYKNFVRLSIFCLYTVLMSILLKI